MTCRDVEAALIDLHEGRLDGPAELRVHGHLETCAECRRRAESWRGLLPAMRAAAPSPPNALRLKRMEREIERRLAGPLEAPRRAAPRWPWIAAPLVAAAALALLLARPRPPVTTPPTPPSPVPFAMVTRDGVPSQPLVSGARVELRAGEKALLRLSTLATLTLTGPSALVLGGDDAHVLLTLSAGNLEAEVGHRRPDQTFVVALPDGRVEVRGTHFVVAAGAAGSWVRVLEGRVATFDSDGHESSVGAGQTHQFAAPAPPAPNPPSAPAVRDACVAPSIDCGRLTASARAAMRTSQFDRVEALTAPALRPRPGCRPLACRTELGYLRAEALRGAGRLDDAIVAYKMLDRRDAPAATRHNALYSAAQLERRLDRFDAARRDYEGALAAAPTGALREEAMLGAMEAADRAGNHAAAVAAARRYLDSFPSGVAATRARRILGTP